MVPTPFFSMYCGTLGAQVDYFHTPHDAVIFLAVFGGSVDETTPGRIWRVARKG